MLLNYYFSNIAANKTYPGNSSVGVTIAENSLLATAPEGACCLLKTRTNLLVFNAIVYEGLLE